MLPLGWKMTLRYIHKYFLQLTLMNVLFPDLNEIVDVQLPTVSEYI